MSATGRTPGMRSDNYPTPAWCVRSLLEELPLPGGSWLEPCAGEGAIIRAVDTLAGEGPSRDTWWPLPRVEKWTAIEVRPEPIDALRKAIDAPGRGYSLYQADGVDRMARFGCAGGPRFDVAITNPPYSIAMQVIERMVEIAAHAVVLLRLNFLGSAARAAFMRDYPPDVYVLPNRPKFGVNKHGKLGSDSIEYAWFHWYQPVDRTHRPFGRVRVLRPVDKIERAFGVAT